MSAPDAELARKARQWLDHADEDLHLARYGLTMIAAPPPYRLIAYHAQQCAEKCLTGYLEKKMDWTAYWFIGCMLMSETTQ
jgi:HEPN domain-containing protein